MRLQGRVVLVTGAASAIGHAVVTLFAREGATVFASDTAPPDKPYPDDVKVMKLNVTVEGDWEVAVDTVVEETGRLDVLINNASIRAVEPLDELTIQDWTNLIGVAQTGVFLGMREAVRVMRRQQSGSIVNISSIWGLAAAAGAHAQHAALGAVRSMSKNAAVTYAGDGIRVNSVHSGAIRMPIADGQVSPFGDADIAAMPMKGGNTPTEVALGCLFLAGDESSCVTGSELVIHGGYLAP